TTEGLDGAPGGTPQTRAVDLYGPGDVIGIDARPEPGGMSGAIFRVEPRDDGVTNFEPNFLVSVDFIDEDFPWRYTPGPPEASATRLKPWLALAVLKDGVECDFHRKEEKQPLDYIAVKDPGGKAFQDPATLWAWAHVHVDAALTGNAVVEQDRAALAQRL